MSFLRQFFRAKAKLPLPSGPTGCRAYAIGDVHGRLDLLDRLLRTIEADIASRPMSQNIIIFLGDLIDRGPDSAGVIEKLRTWKPTGAKLVFLCGNHEEAFLRVLGGEQEVLGNWLKFGGTECLESYGIPPSMIHRQNTEEALATIKAAIPEQHQEFVRSFADTFRFGDYLFVHAGIRPGVELSGQARTDLLWIRSPFLDDTTDHGFVVVHGHTISRRVEQLENRIGIDTGAYRTGRLTAIAIEGTQRWFFDTEADEKAN